jgi:pimeloyl-ACP methyl ester carboxylesterase
MNTRDRKPLPQAAGLTTSGTAWNSWGDGEPIVFIHGVGMNQSVWAPQVEGLRNSFRVITYDMWGHGQSRLNTDARDIGDYAQQLVRLLDDLSISRSHVVGHSMGALIALEIAVAHGERCKSVTALNGVYCRTAQQRTSVQARAAELLTKGKPGSVQGTICRWFGDPVPAQDQAAAYLCTQLLTDVPWQGYARAYDIFAHSDERHLGRLQDINVPTLIATGALDPNSSPVMSEALHACIPGAQLRILPQQRHMMSLIAVDEVNAMIRLFVTDHS